MQIRAAALLFLSLNVLACSGETTTQEPEDDPTDHYAVESLHEIEAPTEEATPAPSVEVPVEVEEPDPVVTGSSINEAVQVEMPEPQEYLIHTVVAGETLSGIARMYANVALEAVMMINEKRLTAQYDRFCANFDAEVRNNPEREELWCNDLYNRPYANLIFPGNELQIPVSTAPQAINTAIAEIASQRIAIVIDDTGSMLEDRQLVSQWYTSAVSRYGRELVGIYLYSDGDIRRFTSAGDVEFGTYGRFENTFGALEYAVEHSTETPDTIVLVTDEAGDDWDWSRVPALPPVIANCLPETSGNESCEENLTRLVNATGGLYIELNPSMVQ